MDKTVKSVYPQTERIFGTAFPVGGWAEPLPPCFTDGKNVITPENYEKIRRCGFDFICSIYASFPKEKDIVLKQLGAAEKSGVKLFISDSAVQKEELSAEKLRSNYGEYKDSPAFLGYLVKDEPGRKMFGCLEERKVFIEKHLGGVPLYYNLLPTYSTAFLLENGYWSNQELLEECDKSAYREYMNGFVCAVKPEFLSYDFYPFAADGSLYRDYFVQLSIASACAKSADIPFIPFVQCCKFNAQSRNPSGEEVRWQANTSIAYGARGLQYFTLWKPVDNEVEKFEGSILGLFGETGERFRQVKKINAFAKKAGKILSSYGFKGVVVSGESPAPVPREDLIREDIKVSGDAIIGVYENDNGKKAYFAVLNRISGSGEISVFSAEKQFRVYTAKSADTAVNGVSVVLQAGEAVLLKEKN